MKILSNLTATATEGPNRKPCGIRGVVIREVAGGHYIRAIVTDQGLWLVSSSPDGLEGIIISHEELDRLAQAHDPHFVPKNFTREYPAKWPEIKVL